LFHHQRISIFNPTDIRDQFPVFQADSNLIYLDNAATSQMPKGVVELISRWNSAGKANIHRGVYDLSNKATREFEEPRAYVAAFLRSDNPKTVGFTSGTTESINVVARSFLAPQLEEGDNTVTTIMEHHANFIPWQQLAMEKGIEFRVCGILDSGELDLEKLFELIDDKTKLVALDHVSNTTGAVNPIQQVIERAHARKVPVLIDAAQSVSTHLLDAQKLDYDFLAFSGHKVFGPFGIGVLYVNESHHQSMQPFLLGGGIIKSVEVEKTQFTHFPYNLDAGTPNVIGAIAMAEALRFVDELGQSNIDRHAAGLAQKLVAGLKAMDGVHVVGDFEQMAGIVSMNFDEIHPHDVASFLNKDGIAVRAGMHCTQPLLNALNLTSMVRASFSVYNTEEEVGAFLKSCVKLIEFWK
jgi:cysteine desulfurase/selenocysteine lyase